MEKDRRQKSEVRRQKTEDGSQERVRGLEGWRCSKKSEKKGFKESEKKGFKDSRIRGVKGFSWYFFKTKERRVPLTPLFHLLHRLPSILIPNS